MPDLGCLTHRSFRLAPFDLVGIELRRQEAVDTEDEQDAEEEGSVAQGCCRDPVELLRQCGNAQRKYLHQTHQQHRAGREGQ